MKLALLKLLLILSPGTVSLICALVWNFLNGPGGQEAVGVLFIGSVVFGIPFVAITGLIVSFITRKNEKAEKHALYGYTIPAALTWIPSLMLLFT